MYRFGEARPLWDFDEYTNYVAVNYEHSRHHHDRVIYVKTRDSRKRQTQISFESVMFLGQIHHRVTGTL